MKFTLIKDIDFLFFDYRSNKDGYPREVAQGIQFEAEIKSCALVIYFEVSDEVMTSRLMNRGKIGRKIIIFVDK